VTLSSIFFIGAVAWVPSLYIYLYKKWKSIPKDDDNIENKKKRRIYGTILVTVAFIGIMRPHRHPHVGKMLKFKKWRVWKAWANFIAMEVISEVSSSSSSNPNFDMKKDQAIFAIMPHGVFPFPLGFAALPEVARNAFGEFRPVVASAARFLPFVGTFLDWLGCVDATKASVENALAQGSRIGLSPGGIAEIFEGYPKPNRLPDDECLVLKSRKGFIRMALKYGVPIIPCYCFGGSKMLKRLQLPMVVEKVSNALRISLVLIFGRWGLPIPFQRRMLYVIGNPIHPPQLDGSMGEDSVEFNQIVDKLHDRFCDELTSLFERHKDNYGWSKKNLRIV